MNITHYSDKRFARPPLQRRKLTRDNIPRRVNKGLLSPDSLREGLQRLQRVDANKEDEFLRTLRWERALRANRFELCGAFHVPDPDQAITRDAATNPVASNGSTGPNSLHS